MLWNNYKMCLIKFLVIGLLVALMGLFFYSMPVRLPFLNITKSLLNSRLEWVIGLVSKETASRGVRVGLVPGGYNKKTCPTFSTNDIYVNTRYNTLVQF